MVTSSSSRGALRQAAHFGIDGLRDLSECQGAVCAADDNPSTRSFDVLDGCLEEMRCRSDHLLFEQPRRQRGRSAGQDSAAACIGPGAVRDDGAIALQDLDVLDPRAEFVGNHLRERGLEPLAV